MDRSKYIGELAALSGLSLQAYLSAANQIVALAVGIATLLYIRAKTQRLSVVSTAPNAQRPDGRA